MGKSWMWRLNERSKPDTGAALLDEEGWFQCEMIRSDINAISAYYASGGSGEG
jgi:hypothetical protein